MHFKKCKRILFKNMVNAFGCGFNKAIIVKK